MDLLQKKSGQVSEQGLNHSTKHLLNPDHRNCESFFDKLMIPLFSQKTYVNAILLSLRLSSALILELMQNNSILHSIQRLEIVVEIEMQFSFEK